jgi:hypothetical protein
MSFLFFLLPVLVSAQSCPLITIAPDLVIMQRIFGRLNTPANLALAVPAWQTTPTNADVCGRPGIVCESCRIVEVDMQQWWINQEVFGSWNVNDNLIGSELAFANMIALRSLILVFGPNSTGILPGSRFNDANPCVPPYAYAENLEELAFIGQPDNPPVEIRSGVGPDYNLFKAILREQYCFQGVSIERVVFFDLPGLRGDLGRASLTDCIGLGLFIISNSPLVSANGFCTKGRTTVAAVFGILGPFTIDPLICSNSVPAAIPAEMQIFSTSLSELPACFIPAMQQPIIPSGSRTVQILDNRICLMQDPDLDVIFAGSPGTGVKTFVGFGVDFGDLQVSRDTQACVGCNGQENISPVKIDICGICGGDGTSCLDCAGVANGTSTFDTCGKCNGLDTECSNCNLAALGIEYDNCGECSSLALSSRQSCDPCKESEKDVCGVCFGGNATCSDCLGVVYGTSRRDRCGVCNGDGRSCVDCNDVPFGTLLDDACGVCGGSNTTCIGCDGIVNSGKEIDRCGVCGGTNLCVDCNGIVNGLALVDECGVCDGDGTECIDCTGQLNGPFRVNRCGQCYNSVNSTGDCDADLLDEQVSGRTTLWAFIVVLIAIGAFCIAILLFAFCSRVIEWCWFGTARTLTLRRRRPDGDEPIKSSLVRRGGAGSFGVKSTVLLSVVMLSGVQAQTSSEFVARELCENTDIGARLPAFCSAPVPSACAFPALFQCENSVFEQNIIVGVTLNEVPLRGVITRPVFLKFKAARQIKISGALSPLDMLPRNAQLRIESTDDIFEGFNDLESLRLYNLQADNFIPLSLIEASKLRVIELTEVRVESSFGRAGILCSLPRLEVLRVRSAGLEGVIDCPLYESGWRRLKELDVRDNQLTGTIPNYAELNSLEDLYLAKNAFSGIHPDAPNLPRTLRRLRTSHNKFTGPLSADWRKFFGLREFIVDDNLLTGSVPILRMEPLRLFDISFNQFTGTIPSQFGTEQAQPELDLFAVNNNRLSEPWPSFDDQDIAGPCRLEHQSICRSLNPPPVPTPTIAFPPVPVPMFLPVPTDYPSVNPDVAVLPSTQYSSAEIILSLVDCTWDCSADSGSKNRLLFKLTVQCGSQVGECPRQFPKNFTVNGLRGVRANLSSVPLDFDLALKTTSVDTRFLFFDYEGEAGPGPKKFIRTQDATPYITGAQAKVILLAVMLPEAPSEAFQFYDLDLTVVDENWLCDAASVTAGICKSGDLNTQSNGRLQFRWNNIPTSLCSTPCDTSPRRLPPVMIARAQTECSRDCRYATQFAEHRIRDCFAHLANTGEDAQPLRLEAVGLELQWVTHVEYSAALINEQTSTTFAPILYQTNFLESSYLFGIDPPIIINAGEEACVSITYTARNFEAVSVAPRTTVFSSYACSIVELQSGICKSNRRNFDNSSASPSLAVDSSILLLGLPGVPLWENSGGRQGNSTLFQHTIDSALCPRYCAPEDVYNSVLIPRECTFTLEDQTQCSGGCGDRSCIGCDGLPNSGKVRDACGICDGTGDACRDCTGVIAGTTKIDACGVCGGNNSTCLDCRGVVLGRFERDVCGVCGGDSSSCQDCFGVPRGTATIDICGVCGGDGTACRDCAGTLNGTARYDEDAVCNGDGSINSAVDDDDDLLVTDIIRVRSSQPVWIFILQLFLLAFFVVCIAFACVSSYRYASRDR